MKDALKGYLALANGLTEVTRQRATAAAKALVAQGEATAGQVSNLADDLVSQSKSNRDAVAALVKYEVDRTLGRVGLASSEEVGELTDRIRALETAVRKLAQAGPAGGAGAADASTTSEKPASGKLAPVSKAPAKGAPVKRTPAKRAATTKPSAKPKTKTKTATAKAGGG